MPNYLYVAVNSAGKKIKGTVEEQNVEAAMQQIKRKGEIPLEIKEETILNKDIELPFIGAVKSRDYSTFCWQLKSIIGAGVSIVPALEMISGQIANKKLREAIEKVKRDVEKGESFSEGMKRQGKIFPDIMINMVQAGEASGDLETSLERMAIHFEKEHKLKSIVKKAMSYPIILCIVIVIVMTVIMTFVIPNFSSTFEEMDMEMPLITQIVIGMSNAFVHYWYMVAAVIGVIVFGLIAFSKTNKGKHVFGWIGMKLPLFGALIVKSASAKFCRTLSTLLGSGLSIMDALEITADNMTNVYFKEAVLMVRDEAAKGTSMATSLERSGIFPMMVHHMMNIGEETGEIEEMLEKVADYYDEEVENATQALTTAIEPAIICVMAVIVGTLVISILLPMMTMYDGIENL